ncbi:nitrous oxidase accessory protein NosD [Methanohalophilus levihalophilus]|nr:nitrous oxidase accessory protein NosD [Methanohalophilus levihalophilus]
MVGGTIKLIHFIKLFKGEKGKRSASSPIVTRILGIVVILLLLTGSSAATETINVDDSGGADHTTIQAAINAAATGDTILVYPGTYTENVVVNKTVNLTSTSGASVTHVVASSTEDDVFTVYADEVTICGFNVSGATDYHKAGIHLDSSIGSKLANNTASNNGYGI